MTTILGLAGLALIPIGLALIWPALGVIALGVELVYLAAVNPEPEK